MTSEIFEHFFRHVTFSRKIYFCFDASSPLQSESADQSVVDEVSRRLNAEVDWSVSCVDDVLGPAADVALPW